MNSNVLWKTAYNGEAQKGQFRGKSILEIRDWSRYEVYDRIEDKITLKVVKGDFYGTGKSSGKKNPVFIEFDVLLKQVN